MIVAFLRRDGSFVPAVESGKAERQAAKPSALTQRKKHRSLTFFDTKKEAKKYSPLQGLPAGGGCKQIIAVPDDYLYVLVSRDTA